MASAGDYVTTEGADAEMVAALGGGDDMPLSQGSEEDRDVHVDRMPIFLSRPRGNVVPISFLVSVSHAFACVAVPHAGAMHDSCAAP
jgi:hypothetical protein